MELQEPEHNEARVTDACDLFAADRGEVVLFGAASAETLVVDFAVFLA